MTLQNAREFLDSKWDSSPGKVDWLGLESLQRAIIESETILDANVKLALLAESIGAWTRRGTPTLPA